MRIRICDLETSGIEPTDHVVEIAAWDLIPEQMPVGPLFVGESYVKPPVPIPPATSAIHHITDEDVQNAAPWAEVYPQFVDDTVDAYCAHNSRFDGQWLTPGVLNGKPLIDTYRAALRIWPEAPGHSNGTLRYWLKPEGLDRKIAFLAHRARADAYVTAHILNVILRQPGVDLAGLILCSSKPALLPRINFGKHKGKAWKDIPPDYINWMIRQPDMGEDVLFSARHHLGGAS